MTETGMSTSNPYDGDRVPGTVGYALPKVRVRVADSKGRRVAAGDVGVLEVKGPNVFKGYWRNPKKTREEFRKDGYFITGDLATKDADGRVTIVGRAKDLIITGGFNVYPKEIESELNELPGRRRVGGGGRAASRFRREHRRRHHGAARQEAAGRGRDPEGARQAARQVQAAQAREISYFQRVRCEIPLVRHA